MTDIGTPYAIQADSHSAQLFRGAVSSMLPRGVGGLQSAQGGIVNAGDLTVAAHAGNTVSVSAGQCWIPGTANAAQGLYYGYNPSSVTLAITPDGSNPTIWLIVAAVNDQSYSPNPSTAGNNEWDIMAVAGTPAATPAIPAVPANSLVLATMEVPTSASSSSAYTIQQGQSTSQGTTPFIVQASGQTSAATIGDPAGRIYNNAAVPALTATQTSIAGGNWSVDFMRGGMAIGGSGNSLVVPVAGIYLVSAQITWATSGGGIVQTNRTITWVQVAGSNVRKYEQYVGGTAEAGIGGSDYINLAANAVLTIAGYQSAGSTEDSFPGSLNTYLSAALVSV